MGFRGDRDGNRMTSHENMINKKRDRTGFSNKPRVSNSGNERVSMEGSRQETIIGSGQGKIKFFNKDKGFGFIERGDGEKDLFVHITQIPRGAQVQEGDQVSFDIGEGRRGLVACNVTVG
jgi:CspA family cold shock protein